MKNIFELDWEKEAKAATKKELEQEYIKIRKSEARGSGILYIIVAISVLALLITTLMWETERDENKSQLEKVDLMEKYICNKEHQPAEYSMLTRKTLLIYCSEDKIEIPR